MVRHCSRCDRDYEYKTGKGMGASKCNPCTVTEHRQNRKKKLVDLFGGKCVLCGYNRCQSSLDFHHIDPSTKEFGIGSMGNTRSWDKMLAEAQKCVLVCRNCHGEIHAGLILKSAYT